MDTLRKWLWAYRKFLIWGWVDASGIVEDISKLPGEVNLFSAYLRVIHDQLSPYRTRHYVLIFILLIWKWRFTIGLYAIHRNQSKKEFREWLEKTRRYEKEANTNDK